MNSQIIELIDVSCINVKIELPHWHVSTAAAQLEMFLSVFSALHYHRYMGRAVATLAILASTLAMALLAATFPYQLPSSLECPVTNTAATDQL